MSRFIESVCFSEGQYHLLEHHQARVNATFKKHFPLTIPFNLASHLPKLDLPEKYKVRVVYSNESIDVEFAEYRPLNIKSLKVVQSDDINYAYKYENRSKLNLLLEAREEADEIIIVKHGKITDSSYSNLAFWDGTRWVTPRTCLLHGVKRQHYLDYGVLVEKEISLKDLRKYEKVSLINAMLDLGEMEVNMENILTE